MTREGIRDQLYSQGIEVFELKYSGSNVSVYQAKYGQYPAAVKVLTATPDTNYSELESECKVLMDITHSHIIRLYTWFWLKNSNQYFFVMVLEWCDKDLAKEIKLRREHRYPWSEAELWEMTWVLTSTLAYMQEIGLAHRDIKPENIFLLQSQGKPIIKIGDFGSAKYGTKEYQTATLTGTPYYLSPLLRQGLVSNSRQVQHNAYKSDVYSMGLTLLTCLVLSQPMSLGLGNQDNEMNRALANACCSEQFKGVIAWMLAWDEANRCDFVQLKAWLDGQYTCQEVTNPREQNPRKLITVQSLEVETFEIAPVQFQPAYPNLQECVPVQYDPTPQGLKTAFQEPIIPPRSMVQANFPPYRLERSEFTPCIGCPKLIDKTSCPVVQLYCDPQIHLFCSRACFDEFCRKEKLKVCPVCKEAIADEIIRNCPNETSEWHWWNHLHWFQFCHSLNPFQCCMGNSSL